MFFLVLFGFFYLVSLVLFIHYLIDSLGIFFSFFFFVSFCNDLVIYLYIHRYLCLLFFSTWFPFSLFLLLFPLFLFPFLFFDFTVLFFPFSLYECFIHLIFLDPPIYSLPLISLFLLLSIHIFFIFFIISFPIMPFLSPHFFMFFCLTYFFLSSFIYLFMYLISFIYFFAFHIFLFWHSHLSTFKCLNHLNNCLWENSKKVWSLTNALLFCHKFWKTSTQYKFGTRKAIAIVKFRKSSDYDMKTQRGSGIGIYL